MESNKKLVLSGLVTLSVLSLAVKYIWNQRAQSVPKIDLGKTDHASMSSVPPEIKQELLSRVQSFFGPQGFESLESAFVIVVGLGGVGSHAANMLVRSGVKKIRLIDFDQVTLSSLNRHAVASMVDVGKSKAETMRSRLLGVVPWCEIEAVTEIFKGSEAERLLTGNPTYVLDCIDDVSTKADLIAHCLKNGIKILTSMGAGGKADPTRLRIAPLSDCINDPLASKIKWKLKKHGVLAENVTAIFSIEKPVVDLLPLDEDQVAAPQDYGVVDYMRLRVVPVLGTSPSIFGQAMASFVLCNLAGRCYEPEMCERLSKNLKHKLMQTFKNNELRRFGTTADIDLDDEDLDFIVCQVWRSRCGVTSRKFGGHSTLALTRWHADRPPHPDNLVLLMPSEITILESAHGDVNAAFSAEIVDKIEQRLRWAAMVIGDCRPRATPSLPSLSVGTVSTTITSLQTPSSHTHMLSLIAVFGLGLLSGSYWPQK